MSITGMQQAVFVRYYSHTAAITPAANGDKVMNTNVKEIRASAPSARSLGVKPVEQIAGANEYAYMNLPHDKDFVKVTNFHYTYLVSGINVATTFTGVTANGDRALFIAAVSDVTPGDTQAALAFANSLKA